MWGEVDEMRFSEQELKELAISAVVIGFSFAWIMQAGFDNLLVAFGVMLISVGSAFIFHEMAHKLVAQRYGCWAEYRMWETGLIAAFFLAVSIGVVFAAPGAVYITNPYGITRRENGHISAAGPLTNLALALIFLLLFKPLPGAFGALGYYGFVINTWLALFNAIPFPPLDGSKIMNWSFQVWGLIALSAFFLLRLA